MSIWYGSKGPNLLLHGVPRMLPSPSYIVNVTSTVVPFGLYAPALDRKPVLRSPPLEASPQKTPRVLASLCWRAGIAAPFVGDSVGV